MYKNLYKLIDKSSHRASSWDVRGKNFDFIQIPSKETKILAEIEGPAIIKHFYFTTILMNPLEFRSAILRIFWDHEETASVEAPLGDFFGVSNCRVRLLNSLMMTINSGFLGSYGFNCYFPMPFTRHARIEIENQGPSALGGYIGAFWYHIDYEKLNAPLPDDIGYFHAYWNREKLTKISEKIHSQKKNISLWRGRNKTGEDNYLILETEGNGQLVGLLLNVDNIAGGWYGEGDDMIFIDEDTWPPSIHGTGSEEIFGAGACPKVEYSGLYTGFHLIENFNYSGHNGMYRWFINDPIRFKKRIRWTIEHGHANNFENDYSSVAYWYQKEPHINFRPIPKLEERLPRLPENYKEIWETLNSVTANVRKLQGEFLKRFPEILTNQLEDAIHSFMMGKFSEALKIFKDLSLKLLDFEKKIQ